MTPQEPPVAVGGQIRRYRNERNLSLSELAALAKVSKAYLSELENGQASRVSGEKLYAIATALGVNMSDLLGRKLIKAPTDTIPEGLRAFAEKHHLPEADVQMLARIEFRGGQPQSEDRWAFIYSAIQSTEWMDRGDPNA